MAFEKRWGSVPPRLFVSNGLASGQITLADTTLFKVKQKVAIIANGEPNLELEVKAVISDTVLFVGPYGNINSRSNLSAYTLAKNAAILADEQPRSGITADEIRRARFDEEPTIADRSVLVDEYGRYYKLINPLPTTISDGEDQLEINPDGSINVNAGGGVNAPTIYNIAFPLANTEQTVLIPQNVKRFIIKVRGGNCKAQFSYTNGQSGIEFVTIEYANWYQEENLILLGDINLYIQVSKPNQVVELITWK